MTTPIATTNSSKHELALDFERRANRSFELCIQALLKVDFYKSLLRGLEAGKSIADQLPVVEKLPPDLVTQTVQNLLHKAQFESQEAWELPKELKGSFSTTVTSQLPDGELIPQYLVHYEAETKAGSVKVIAKNWRRNVSVVIEGSREAMTAAYGRMIWHGVKGNS